MRENKHIIQGTITALLLSWGHVVLAQGDCYAMAQSFYEQVYCDITAQSSDHGLPPFYEFKRNDGTTQALLLRRPGKKVGIDVPMPASNTKPRSPASSTPPGLSKEAPPQPSNERGESAPPNHSSPLARCTLKDTLIQCPDKDYQLVGNESNDDLAPDALEPSNKMALPKFEGNFSDEEAVRRYLHKAYQRYVEQMFAIGLGGATTTYGRFVFLFDDIQSKGLDFRDRFETMYTFLKKDKANMGVNTIPATDGQLQLEDCDPLTSELLVCSRQGRNYIFRETKSSR